VIYGASFIDNQFSFSDRLHKLSEILANFLKIILFSLLPKNGFVAEWLGRALQKLLQQFESARNLPADKRKPSILSAFFFFAGLPNDRSNRFPSRSYHRRWPTISRPFL
jgi:hypothetical protein